MSLIDVIPAPSPGGVRAVVLDWGGVMSNAGRAGQVGENLARALGVDPTEGKRLVAAADAALKRGLAGESDFWARIEGLIGRPVPAHQRDIWIPSAQLAPHPDMVEEVRELRAAGYLVGLLTNTHPAASRAVDSIQGYEGFDAVVASDRSRSHSAKPEPEAYREVLADLGVTAHEALFVDDQEKALAGARQVGLHTLRADPGSPAFPGDLRANLHATLYLINGGGGGTRHQPRGARQSSPAPAHGTSRRAPAEARARTQAQARELRLQ